MSIKYKHEARSYGIDVKVGWHHHPDTPALTDDERNEAGYIAQRMWWDEADRLCQELGFDGCTQAGRSGGWLIPVPAVEDEEGIEALDAAIQPMLHGDALDEYFLRAAASLGSELRIIPPGLWENDTGPQDWYAVEDAAGIIAYFAEEEAALRFCKMSHHSA